MRDFIETNSGLALAMVGGAIAAGPVLGLWPLVGVIAACATSVYIASMFRPR
jgi:hypothetical protein